MSENICLPKEQYYILLGVLSAITIFYIYNLNEQKFKLDLNSSLSSESSKINQIIETPIIIKHHHSVPQTINKRIILEQRDRGVINDILKPPERRDQEYAYPNRYIREVINIPSRGSPDNFQTVGVLARKADEKILQLFGRQKFPGSNQWEYYVAGMDRNGFPNKMPIKVRGDREIEDKQQINVEWLDKSKGAFEVNLYDYNVPRYNPYT